MWAAITEEEAKSKWFGGAPVQWELLERHVDVRVGGRERLKGRWKGGWSPLSTPPTTTRVIRNIGIVRGIVVRSTSVVGNIAGGLQSLFGGNISIYTNLCERTRTEAYQMMCEQADANGANAILMMRYDAKEIFNGVTEVRCRLRFEPNSADPSRSFPGAANPPYRHRKALSRLFGLSISRSPGNGILRAETGRRFQAQNTGERSEFGSQTATRLANRPKLRGLLPTRKPRRFARTGWMQGSN